MPFLVAIKEYTNYKTVNLPYSKVKLINFNIFGHQFYLNMLGLVRNMQSPLVEVFCMPVLCATFESLDDLKVKHEPYISKGLRLGICLPKFLVGNDHLENSVWLQDEIY